MAYDREYVSLKEERSANRQSFRVQQQRRHPGRVVTYPDQLAMMPPFSTWLRQHVQELRATDFPLDEKLIQLSAPPSAVAESYSYMWSYGALLRCIDDESAKAYTTFDSGICTSVSERAVDRMEVGILKGIYHVSFSGWNIVFLKAECVKQDHLKKDRMGFWSCKLDVREDRRRMNPFMLPVNVEQVFFIEDVLSPGWNVVLRHEPRARRIVGNSELAFSHAPIHSEFAEIGQVTADRSSIDEQEQVRQVPLARVLELDANLTRGEDDSHFDDNEYEDDPECDLPNM